MVQDPLAAYRATSDWTASRLESDPDAGNYRRCQGFGRAAILLLEAAEAQEHWNDRDPLLLPALYSFRHYVELELKELGREAVAFGARPPGNPWVQTRREGLRLLAHPDHPATPLPVD